MIRARTLRGTAPSAAAGPGTSKVLRLILALGARLISDHNPTKQRRQQSFYQSEVVQFQSRATSGGEAYLEQ